MARAADHALSGSSRLEHGVDPETLAAELSVPAELWRESSAPFRLYE